MATQRPSVDVITGVIKANLPTRISFQVTSKIDSRTILGEQGAEQLLGKGDMLYMPGGKQIIRVHGPFVSDEECARSPTIGASRACRNMSRRSPRSRRTAAICSRASRSATIRNPALPQGDPDRRREPEGPTSYLQRQLRVGYNSAARLIERMEKDGLVGQPDHVGRREVLIDTDGHPI